jgi:hypothetical protein
MEQKQKAAYEALQNLMDDPGQPFQVWDDLVGLATLDSPYAKMANDLLGLPKYDDRAAALVYGATLEHSLEIAIATYFVADPKAVKRVFNYSAHGPLATFDSKIRLGLALGVFDQKMYDDLLMLKQIRNAFAHAKSIVNFYTPAVVCACDSLSCQLQGRVNSPLPPARERFTFIVAFVSTFLSSDPSSPRSFKSSALYSALYKPRASPEKHGPA